MSRLSFRYRAIDTSGGLTRGVLRARSREEAYRQITSRGLRPVRIAGTRIGRRRRRVSTKSLSHLSYQFAVVIEAGMPIVEGLRSIAEQQEDARLRPVLEDVAERIEGGCPVTDAISPHHEVFGEVYIETVRAAEASGNMAKALHGLGEMLERRHAMLKDIRGALLYPACVLTALVLAVAFLMVFVVPRFAEMFASRDIPLPGPTRIVIAASELTARYWFIVAGAIAAAVWGAGRAWRSPSWRRRIDTWLHRVPFVRQMLRGLAIGRFAHILGLAIRSGLGLIEAIEMAGRASGRPLLCAEADNLADQVKLGRRLTDALHDAAYLPPFTRRMLASGAEAGELTRMCEIIARDFDREVAHLSKNVTTVIEPVLIVALAGLVLLMALAFFLPMWDMAALIR